MSTFKTIISGRLEFGSARSYEKVVGLFQHRVENYYRNAVLLRDYEEIFDAEDFAINIPRMIVPEALEKNWKNTINLLKYINDYAIAGNMRVWVIQDRKLIREVFIEPTSDKVAVQSFLKGRELIKVEGMEAEAMQALNRAIGKFERHALAYERRGYVNLQLRNYKDALYDFSKSIDINPNNAEPYWGRANIRLKENDIKGALADLEMVTKKSIPHQSLHWNGRRLKGKYYLETGEFKKAIFELKLFTSKKFKPEDSNKKYSEEALSDYGKALLESGEFSEAINVFNKALEVEENQKEPKAEQLLYRGIARQKAGQSGFVKDFKEAAKLGSEKATEMLESIA
jgi:tetratricopeptide (TPR) repeat protein